MAEKTVSPAPASAAAAPDNRGKVFVGNLSFQTRDDELKAFVETIAPV
jgi:RNA recognition motif-containing protein